MVEIIYHDDMENNEDSHELFLTKALNSAPDGVYGKDLSTALDKLVQSVLDNYEGIQDFLTNISSKNVQFIADKATNKEKSNVILHECYVDDEGITQERPIRDTMDMRVGGNVVSKRYNNLMKELIRIMDSNSYGNKLYIDHLLDFFTDLKNSFIMLPTLVYIESIKRLQFTWVRRDGLRLVLNITNNSGLSLYASFRDINPNISDSSIEVKSIEDCKDLLKILGFYAV